MQTSFISLSRKIIILSRRVSLGGLVLLSLWLTTGFGVGEDPKPVDAKERLGGDLRYLAHVSTDKPIYRSGETLYVRAVVAHALTRAPLLEKIHALVEIVSPKGDTVASAMALCENGALGYQWHIAEGVAGGDYKVKVSFPAQGYPPAEREFNIRAYRQRRLRTQIEFLQKGYAPGDIVAAILEVSRSEGGFPVGAKATVVARVDGREAWRGAATVDGEGFAQVHFELPDVIEKGEGTLSFAIEDGGVVETASKTIPILVGTVDLRLYPEGGDVVAGVENRVYFEATAPNGRPTDIAGELVDSKGKVLLTARTEHEGRGSFSFLPLGEESYTFCVVEPWTITTSASLPAATERLGLRADKARYGASEPLALGVRTLGGSFRVEVSNREVLLAEKVIEIKSDLYAGAWIPVEVKLPESACGVLRVTVFNTTTGLPEAERLVYREPASNLHVSFELDREAYVPGGKVQLKIKTTNDAGEPVAGFVGLTVTDDATLEMVERREQAPRLPVQVFIEHEVRKLADAAVYLSHDAKAPRALDLLLGTQGWRRFAFVEVDDFIETDGDAARRVLGEKRAIAAPGGRVRWDKGARPEENGELLLFNAALPVVERLAVLEDGLILGEEFENKRVPRPAAAEAAPAAAKPLDAAQVKQNLDAKKEDVRMLGLRDPARKDMDAFELPVRKRKALGPVAIPTPVAMGELRANLDIMDRERFLRHQVVAVRVYAHAARPDRQPNDRVDFAETLYWSAALATDEKGEATVSFDLSDSVTSFRAMADGYTKVGAFGQGDSLIEARRPFYAVVKAPLEVTAGDRVELPLVLVNETDQSLDASVLIEAGPSMIISDLPQTLRLPPHSRVRRIVLANMAEKAGPVAFTLKATAGDFSDTLTRTLSSQSLGFPMEENFGGTLEKPVAHTVTIPKSITEGGITADLAVYPTPLANLTKALESLIRDPSGCFEQTSSTNYPLVMAMQYFQTHEGVDPDLIKRSSEKLDKGYKRLVGYECKQKGYEWFGGDPGHEALTAYGLLEFQDMAQVQPVDPKMLERTRAWLIDRRDGKGGFKRNKRALDSFGGAPDDITNAYIIWALAGSGEKDIAKELDALRSSANESQDPYLIALAAGALNFAGRGEDAAPLLKRLAAMQDKDGSINGAKTTITRSGGQSLLVETTSLAVLAWLSDKAYAGNVEKAMQWICTACEDGRFGATQSTVLALKAIIEYDKSRARPKAPGKVILSVDGKRVETIAFTQDTKEGIVFKDFSGTLTPGQHVITLRMQDGSPMPYSLAVRYHAETPSNSPDCPLELETKITESVVAEGEPVEIIATLRNTTDEGLPMTMAVIGIPGGLEPRHEQLKESVKAGKFSFYEVRGREVAIYFRDMAPKSERTITISAIAAVPGEFTAPASRAYLYYTPEEKKWNEGAKVTVIAK